MSREPAYAPTTELKFVVPIEEVSRMTGIFASIMRRYNIHSNGLLSKKWKNQLPDRRNPHSGASSIRDDQNDVTSLHSEPGTQDWTITTEPNSIDQRVQGQKPRAPQQSATPAEHATANEPDFFEFKKNGLEPVYRMLERTSFTEPRTCLSLEDDYKMLLRSVSNLEHLEHPPTLEDDVKLDIDDIPFADDNRIKELNTSHGIVRNPFTKGCVLTILNTSRIPTEIKRVVFCLASTFHHCLQKGEFFERLTRVNVSLVFHAANTGSLHGQFSRWLRIAPEHRWRTEVADKKKKKKRKKVEIPPNNETRTRKVSFNSLSEHDKRMSDFERIRARRLAEEDPKDCAAREGGDEWIAKKLLKEVQDEVEQCRFERAVSKRRKQTAQRIELIEDEE